MSSALNTVEHICEALACYGTSYPTLKSRLGHLKHPEQSCYGCITEAT